MTTIELVDIEKELDRLWDEEQGKNKTRACLFNLIIYTQKTKRDLFFQKLIHSVVSKFPCRIVLITSDDAALEEYLKTSVSTETVGEGSLQIFCEIIHIEVAGNLHQRVPYIVLPLLLPDLPVHLLWTQDPAEESVVLPALEPFASRIILDSESMKDLQKFSKTVLDLGKCFHCEIGDLNWSAFSGWRDVIHATFSSVNGLSHLFSAKEIVITYNRSTTEFQKRTEIEGAYLQGWLAAQLGWEFKKISGSEGKFRLDYETPEGGVSLSLIPREQPKLPPGSLLELEVSSRKGSAHYSFKRHPDVPQVFVQYSDSDRCELPTCSSFSGVSEGEEIVEEIFYQRAGEHYGNMLKLLSQIPWSETQ